MYSGKTGGGGARTFGTSGLLYRSNKLMYDRQSWSLWSNLTGEPVLGRLAQSPVRLEILAATLTTWAAWFEAHPKTTVLVLSAEHGERWGFRYLPGEADRARSSVAFPVWQKSAALEPYTEVYGLRLGDLAKAYELAAIFKRRVLNDTLGTEPLLVVADPKSGAVRVYRRGSHSFERGASAGELRDEAGRIWRLTEEALVADDARSGEDRLARVPGHVALWFGWFGFFPRTELYGGSTRPGS